MFDPKKELSILLAQKNWTQHEVFTPDNLKQVARESLYTFEEWMLIVKHAKPEESVPIMNTYAMHVNKLHDVRDAFEYASVHEQMNVLEQLLDKHRADDLLTEWISVYKLIYETLLNEYTLQERLEKVKDLYGEVKNPLARMRLDIYELSTYFNMGIVRNALYLADKLRNDFATIKPSYMKSALASRVSLLIGSGKLYGEGDIKSAEDYFFAVNVNETTPDAIRASSFHALSNTKLIDNKELCLQYTREAIKFADRAGLISYKEVLEQERIPFIKNLYGETFDLSDTIPEEEQIHQHIVRNETGHAQKMLKKLEDEGKNSLFLLYYKAKATKDVTLFTNALSQFSIFGRAYMIPVVLRDIVSLQKGGNS
ncbi:AimR family lysis-lysogeny pheromone receptor [Alkalihalobacillus clausii]|uniref:AimR family lysis-lysogeny pheromone receptor n=1 Tax=Shouchella clausii TaxID=79880 RepID=UPI000BA667D9|nr:AimR family lysis-lysogeny pheromone receptor [Shouchella clausii]MCM3549253.1 AimR family lysis-lysogeny pheromone receptor [Shouchella clausii]PAF14018.1 hypothetical protein CHH59_11240 [Shouchella clausii]